jgi:hypothetical protein
LRFANTSPPSGCVGDLHPLAIEHARHTTKPLRGGEDCDLARFPMASATHSISPVSTPPLNQGAPPCYSPAGPHRAASFDFVPWLASARSLPELRPLPSYSIPIKQKPCPSRLSSTRLYPKGRNRPGESHCAHRPSGYNFLHYVRQPPAAPLRLGKTRPSW